MSYGSSATWGGTDTSNDPATVDFTAATADSDGEAGVLTAPSFILPGMCTPVTAAAKMAAALGGGVTANGARVNWPTGTTITNMSFTVNGGPPQEVPAMDPGNPPTPTTVVSQLNIKNS